MAELVATANGLLEREDLGALDLLLSQAIRDAPTTSELYLLKGMLHERQGRSAEAESSFGRAIYCDATCSLAWFHRAVLLERRGERERAAVDYETASRCFARDDARRWDLFLESMGHGALARHCQERATVLSRPEGGVS